MGEKERRRKGERNGGRELGSKEGGREGSHVCVCVWVGVYVNACESVRVSECIRSGGGCECVHVCMFGLRTRARFV
jgi:hypothetical protein